MTKSKRLGKLGAPRKRFVTVGLLASLCLAAAAAFVLTVLVFVLQPGSIIEYWDILWQNRFVTFFLNYLPIILVVLILYFITNNIVLSCGLTGFATLILSYANRTMINMRQDPFKPYDIMLGAEFAGISRSMDKSLFIALTAGIAGFVLLLAVCLYFIRNKQMGVYTRIFGTLATATLLIVVNGTALSSKKLYALLRTSGNVYNMTDNYQSKGFIYSFIYTFNTSSIERPAGYANNKLEIESRISSFAPVEPRADTLPNVVLILSEAFSDILNNPALDYTGYTDPMKNYNRLAAESLTGSLIVPNVGGGTADTEFDIFTGINSRHFRGVAYAYNLIAKQIDALPLWLARAGYENISLHPGFGWFYNRQNVYKYMGFSDFITQEQYDKSDTRGMYITERQTIERIISEYTRHVDTNDSPFFEFCVTIQNHGPYLGKYNATKNFNTTLELSDDSMDALYNYVDGMLDVDRELQNLVDFFSGRAEPIVMIIFGDHLPSFANDIYDALIEKPDNDFAAETRLNNCPYVIWRNDASRLLLNPSVPQEEVMSSNFFGAYIMQLLGLEGMDPFVDYVNELREKYPVITEGRYLDANGEYADVTDEADIDLYRSWEYYRVFNQ
ncbi:MAG: LTA synthase family protein [Clostridiales bacterium]|nr:LTA synthase family protein [Clostridiales bacterium]